MALSKDQAEVIRQALGLGDVPDKDIEELAGTKAGMAFLSKVKGQGGGGGIGRFISEGVQGLEQAPGTKNIEKLFGGIEGSKPAPKKSDPAKKSTATDQSDALAQLAQYLTQGYVQQGEVAMGQMGQQLAQQNQAVTSTVDQFLTGTPSGNPAVDAAQAAYAKAYSAGEGLNSAAYANMGTANENYLAASPLQPVLSILTSGLGSGQYKQLPSSLVQNLPPEVQYALQQAGVGVTNPGSTGTSGQPIPTPKGGWPSSITAGQKAVPTNTLSGLLSGALAPSSTNPVSNPPQYGNPNVPGQ